MSKAQKVTEYQERVYALLQQIPEGRITTYAAMSKALNSSPRAVGGALRNNPFAPEIPCHRCIASTGVSHLVGVIQMGDKGTQCADCLYAVYWRLQGRLGEGAERAESGVEAEAPRG